MKKKIIFFACLFLSFIGFGKVTEIKVTMNNLSITIYENWTYEKQYFKNGDFRLKCTKDNTENFVEITCKTKVIEPTIRVNEIASERSLQEHFDYMQIDGIQNKKLKKHNAKLLLYTNIFLNEVSKGGIYSFVFEGYTYTVEYFGEDTPSSRKELEKIVNSFTLTSAEKQRNIVDMEEDYQEQNWKVYNDTTSLQTKVNEYGDDLLMINTSNNYKEVNKTNDKDYKINRQISELQEKKSLLENQLSVAQEQGEQKKEKKLTKQISKIDKKINKLSSKLQDTKDEQLRIQLKEKK